MGIYIDRVRDDETMVMYVFFYKGDLYLKVKEYIRVHVQIHRTKIQRTIVPYKQRTGP